MSTSSFGGGPNLSRVINADDDQAGGDCSALRPGSAVSMNVIIGVPSHNVPILVVAVAVDGHDHWSAVSWDLGPGCDEGPRRSVLRALQRASKISDTEDVVV